MYLLTVITVNILNRMCYTFYVILYTHHGIYITKYKAHVTAEHLTHQ